MITALLIPLPAVCAFATIQRLGADPLWGELTITRVGATSGNAVALGAYFVTLLPFLGYRLAALLSRRPAPLLACAWHLGLLAWAGLCLVWSAGRGPTVGLAAGLIMVGWVTLRRLPRPALRLPHAVLGLGAALAGLALVGGGGWALFRLLGLGEPYASFAACLAAFFCLICGAIVSLALGRAPAWVRLALLWLAGLALIGASVLNLPSERAQAVLPAPVYQGLESWRTIPWVWRFSRLLDAGKSTGKVRAILWDGAVRQLRHGCVVTYPDGATDRLEGIRWLVGWGQETQALTFLQFYSPELAVLESADQRVDRLHNQTFDLLVTQGALGLAAWHALFLAGLVTCLRRIGFQAGWPQVVAWLLGGIAAAALVAYSGAYLWLGLAFPVGALVGMACSIPGTAAARPTWQVHLSSAVLAVLVGHLIEVQVGFPLVPSTINVFLALALVSRLGDLEEQPEPATPWEPPVLTLVLTWPALALLNPIPYMLQLQSASQVPSVQTLVQNFLWSAHNSQSFDNPAGACWLLAGWLGAAGLAWVAQPWTSGLLRRAVWLLIPPLGVLAVVVAAAGPLRTAYFWVWLSDSTLRVPDAVDLVTAGFMSLVLVYGLAGGIALVWLAAVLPRSPGPARGLGRSESLYLAPLVTGLAVLLVWNWSLKPAVADALYAQAQNVQKNQAEQAGAAEGWFLPVSTLEKVVKLAPSVDMYTSFLGEYLGRQASLTKEPADLAYLRGQARQYMVRARELAPLEPNNASNLGLVNLQLVRLLPEDDPRRAQLLAEAKQEYYRAVQLSPFNVPLIVEFGNRLIEDYQDLQGAESLYRDAIRKDPRYFGAYYGLASVLERRARQQPIGSSEGRRLMAAAAATALAGTRMEPASVSRDAHVKVMKKLFEAAGLPPVAIP